MEAVRPKPKTKAKKKARSKPAHKQEEKEETAEEVVLQPAAATSAPEDVAADSNTKDIPQLPLLPTLEAAAQDSGQDPLEVFRPQATERGGAEGVVNTGGDLINFDSVTPSAAAAASQEKHLNEMDETHKKEKEKKKEEETKLDSDGLSSQKLEDKLEGGSVVSQFSPKTLGTSSTVDSAPVVRQQEEATSQIPEAVLAQGSSVQEDTQVSQQVTVSQDTAVSAQATAPLFMEVEEERVYDPVYPQLDSLMAAAADTSTEQLIPFSEEDLALLYPNPQLAANDEFIENFIRESYQEQHPLAELLQQYLNARLDLRTSTSRIEGLRRDYNGDYNRIWTSEERSVSGSGRCRDGNKVSQNHLYQFAIFSQEAAHRVEGTLDDMRNTLQENLCMKSYSAQLACIHVENYLYQLLLTIPEVTSGSTVVTGYLPMCHPGGLDAQTTELRNCISVLFMFERRPVRDEEFSKDCRKWLDILLAALLRTASLSDHHFILHHLLRSPPSIGQWGAQYLQLLSPVTHRYTPTRQHLSHDPSAQSYAGYISQEWNTGMGLEGGRDWGGPVLDMVVTTLSSLLQPISKREEFLSLLAAGPRTAGTSRQDSQLWTYVDEELEEMDATDETQLLMLKESDFIALFEQIPIKDIFQHILQVPQDGSYSVSQSTSLSMLRLIAFTTTLISILGGGFNTLKHSRYKEFVKLVGRTIRQSVHFVADHWINYKAMKEAAGDTPTSMPTGEDPGLPRYSLARLQVEFDQCVLRATKWILTAHKLGAWQFMADMPYRAVTLSTLWQILWTLYSYQLTTTATTAPDQSTNSQSTNDQSTSDQRNRNNLTPPQSTEEILIAIKDENCHTQLVDMLMKTYSSEAVFLLTTFVNMARSRTAESDEERLFINTVSQEIFELTQVDEFAKDTYSRMGRGLIGAIATVHPFTLSTLLERTVQVVDTLGENCIPLFKELPLQLWTPLPPDVEAIRHWLVTTPLHSPHNMLARVIISGLNWGVRSNEPGSCDLVLEPALHQYMAMTLVDACSRHLPNQPGGCDYNSPSASVTSSTVSTLTRYAASFRSSITSEQSDFTSWVWEVVLMLKLHPVQLNLLKLTQSKTPTANTTPTSTAAPEGGAKSMSVYKSGSPPAPPMSPLGRGGADQLPDLSSPGLEPVRDVVHKDGLIGYYVAMNITNIGSEPGRFIDKGIPMLLKLQEEGYHLPVLRILSCVTPLLFNHRKMIINDQNFIQLVHNLANSDPSGTSLKERLLSVISSSSPPLIVQKLSAMITTQLHQCMSSDEEVQSVLTFWLDTFFSIPAWLREQSILYLLDSVCVMVSTSEVMKKILVGKLLEQYQLLQPLQQKSRRLISSVTSSVLSLVGQESGPPSLYAAIPQTEFPWLAYYTLCAEQVFEEEEGVWKSLLSNLKKDGKTTVDSALKKSLSDLRHTGSSFTTAHLCIYRWADFCSTVDHSFILMPLAWQRFYSLYLQRPLLNSTMPERASFGLRFFISSSALSQRRSMKTTLISIVKSMQQEIDQLLRPAGDGEASRNPRETQEKTAFLQNCLRFYKTLKSWLEDPRLHDEALHLPALPPQYDPDRLGQVFSPARAVEEWVEFVRVWEVREKVEVMVEEWLQVVSYQKELSFKSESQDTNPDVAALRIDKRLKWKSNCHSPPSLRLPAPPFSMVTREMLLDKDAVLNIVMSDINFITQQARVFSERVNMLAALDSEFTTGIPDLYSNQPRQFHVNVPCRSKFSRNHVCHGPATIVYRFNERTPHPVWEERLRQNRAKHTDVTAALSMPVAADFCKAVARTEHVISKLSAHSSEPTSTGDNLALTCGVALFYELLKFVTSETRNFPPSCQFLTSCVDILGQEFIERDPEQAVTILQLLLHQRMLGGMLAPLFHPNACPAKFLEMYSSIAQVATKEGPNVAFSVLSKFNMSDWLDQFAPSTSDCTRLLEHIYNGLAWCGHTPQHEHLTLCGVYRIHLKLVIEYNFPNNYSSALQLLIDGTDKNQLSPRCWEDISEIVNNCSSPDNCRLGLQRVQDTLSYLAHHFMEKRLFVQESLYDVLSHDYIDPIGQFLNMLCISMVMGFAESVEMGNSTHEQALKDCWSEVTNVFAPWTTAVQSTTSIGGSSGDLLLPCKLEHLQLMSTMVGMFCGVVSKLQTLFSSHIDDTPMYLFWFYYCSTLALPNTPEPIMDCYHTHLMQLPWKQFLPDLLAMDSMIKLKTIETFPKSSFLFLGRIFPLIDWKSIIAMCSGSSDPAVPVQFHNVLLQLLLMLASCEDVMNRQDCLVTNVMSDAAVFNWHYLDAKNAVV